MFSFVATAWRISQSSLSASWFSVGAGVFSFAATASCFSQLSLVWLAMADSSFGFAAGCFMAASVAFSLCSWVSVCISCCCVLLPMLVTFVRGFWLG